VPSIWSMKRSSLPWNARARGLSVRLLLAAAVTLAGCHAAPAVSPAAHVHEVARSATFDHDCPVEQITVVAVDDGASEASEFDVLVCGHHRTYRRIGTLYYDEELVEEVDI
jgi:hypothetical protein